MKSIIKNGKLYKRLLILGIGIYVICIFMNQQKSLATYKNQKEYYEELIAEQEQTNKELTELKENVNSKEYIEEMAREKLDMYLPNERVYIDIGK